MQENIIQEPVVETKMEKFGKLVFKVTMAIFIISGLSGFIINIHRHLIVNRLLGRDSVLSQFIEPVTGLIEPGMATYFWYIAAIAGAIFPTILLIVGAATYKKGGNRLIKFAVRFFAIAIVVGTGISFLNMFSIGG